MLEGRSEYWGCYKYFQQKLVNFDSQNILLVFATEQWLIKQTSHLRGVIVVLLLVLKGVSC